MSWPDPTPEFWARVFVAGPEPGDVLVVEIDHGVSAAYDLLTDDGYDPDRAAEIAAAARRNGHDPEAIARKMRRLRSALHDDPRGSR